MAKDNKNKIVRTTPNNVEAEEAVLGSVLIDGEAANNVISFLKPSDFYIEANRTVFDAMQALYREKVAIDTYTVADKLTLWGKLDEVGSIDYLTGLADRVLSAANCMYYAEIVKRDGLIRKVINTANKIASDSYSMEDGKAALQNAEKLIFGIAEGEEQTDLQNITVPTSKILTKIGEMQDPAYKPQALYTGFGSFDFLTHGMKPGELILIAARPSVGKTALALNIANYVGVRNNKTVAIFSLEMSAELLVKRMLANLSGVSLGKMEYKGGAGIHDTQRLFASARSMTEKNIFIDDYSMNTPQDVLSKCRRLKRERGSLDLIIIDYLQLMTASTDGRAMESRQVEVSTMSRQMKVYARELNCPIILLSQMSRDAEKRDDPTPKLSDLRESGAIEQDADVVAFLDKPILHTKNKKKKDEDEDVSPNDVRLLVRKNRNGPTGNVQLRWTGETTTFKDVGIRNEDGTIDQSHVYKDEVSTSSDEKLQFSADEDEENNVNEATLADETSSAPTDADVPARDSFDAPSDGDVPSDGDAPSGDVYSSDFDGEFPSNDDGDGNLGY